MALVPPRARLVVAVSGGPDSLALLHILARQGLHSPDKLIVAHLNHGLRPESGEEAAFVAEVAASWRLKYQHEYCDVARLARDAGLSLEEAGRQARYDFLSRVAREAGTRFIATGHNADDQAETVLMHFVRGTGLAGLRGMLPVGPLPNAPDLVLIRPLLDSDRQEIERYCRDHNLEPNIDESNLDSTFFRNRLRHELLPLLETYNPQIKARLAKTAETIRADYGLLDELAEEAWGHLVHDSGDGWLQLDLQQWRALPLSLRRMTLRRAVYQLRPALRDLGFETVDQARLVAEGGNVGAQAALPDGLKLSVGYEIISVSGEEGSPLPDLPQLPSAKPLWLPLPGRQRLAGEWWVNAHLLEEIDLVAVRENPDPWQAYVDAGELDGFLLRSRLPGERFQPLGMGGHSAEVAEVMINRKIPAALRERWPIVASRDHLLWLVGHHLDERVRVTPATGVIAHLIVGRQA